MLKGNMPVGDSVRRKGREDLTIKSIIWKSIIDIFKLEKGIDITKELVSIRLRNKTILVKISKPIIKTELHYISDRIQHNAGDKLKKLGININDFDIRYI